MIGIKMMFCEIDIIVVGIVFLIVWKVFVNRFVNLLKREDINIVIIICILSVIIFWLLLNRCIIWKWKRNIRFESKSIISLILIVVVCIVFLNCVILFEL